MLRFFFFKQKTAYEMRISDWSQTCALPILISFLANVYKKGYVPAGAVNWGDADNNAAFYSHQVVMTFNPSLSIPAGKQGDQKVYPDIVTMEPPAGVDGKATPSLVAVNSVIVPAGSKHVDLAKAFLQIVDESCGDS